MKAKTGIVAAVVFAGFAVLWAWCGRWAAAELVYPVENGATRVRRHVLTPLADALTRPHLARENRRLTADLELLLMRAREYETLAAENARLRALVDYPPRVAGSWLPAPVLSAGGALGEAHLIRLGKGARAGVRPGASVACTRGLVGRVVRVTPHTADVRLISDPALRVAAEIDTGDAENPVAFGLLAGTRLTCLARTCCPPAHARVRTSGRGGVYPRDLPLGTLAGPLQADDSGLEKEGEIVPAVDFTALEDVFVRRED